MFTRRVSTKVVPCSVARFALFSVFFIWLTGCAGTERYTRSEPSTHFPVHQTIDVPVDLQKYVTVHCLLSQKVKYEDTSSKNSVCVYVSADVSRLGTIPIATDGDRALRNQAMDMLLSISDLNCSNFLHRAFANRAGLDYTKTLLESLTTAGAAGTTFISPAAAAALSGANLVIGKSVDSFTATYYVEQTFHAMESAIEGARLDKRTEIDVSETDSKKSPTYSMADGLADIREYDDDCSIRGGLSRLAAVASTQKDKNKGVQQGVASADADTKAETYKTLSGK